MTEDGSRRIEPPGATADIIRQNVKAGADTCVNVNGHYEGSGPLTIRWLMGLWGRHDPNSRWATARA
jgi:hypothetical protein